MKSGPVHTIGNAFRLTDLTGLEDSEATFDILVRLIVWRIQRDEKPNLQNSDLLRQNGDASFNCLALFLYFAAQDPEFFILAKHMTASELAKPEATAQYVRLVAAQLLVMKQPKQKKTKSTIDALIVMAIAVKNLQGNLPTGKKSGDEGSIVKLETALQSEADITRSFDRLQQVWKQRDAKLCNVGFGQEQISEFFAQTSPKLLRSMGGITRHDLS